MGWADNIYFSFEVPGHTKFGPDRWFGLIGKHIISVDAWNINDLINNISAALKHQQHISDFTQEDCINFKPALKEHYKKPDFAVSEEYHFWFSSQHKGSVRFKSHTSQPEWSEPHRLRESVGKLKVKIAELPKFCLIPLSKERIKTMRDCKQLLNSNAKLDVEESWDLWDPPLCEIDSILECRIRNGLTEYKVKFSNSAYANEWKTSTELVNATKLIKSWKGEVKKCSHIKKVHEADGELLLVQWHGWPNKQDWSWEERMTVVTKANSAYLAFANQAT